VNLHTSAAENVLFDLIDDYFVDDGQLHSDSDSDDVVEIMPPMTDNVNAHEETFLADNSDEPIEIENGDYAIANNHGGADGRPMDKAVDGQYDNDDDDDNGVNENEIDVVMDQVDIYNNDPEKELERIENVLCECTRRGKI
jgi:hypothetical protein